MFGEFVCMWCSDQMCKVNRLWCLVYANGVEYKLKYEMLQERKKYYYGLKTIICIN
jgi:hypothetical protein